MWKGSFPRPSPDGRKNVVSSIDFAKDLGIYKPLRVTELYNQNNYGIALWDKYMVFNSGNLYDISDVSNPILKATIPYRDFVCTNDKYVICNSSGAAYLSVNEINPDGTLNNINNCQIASNNMQKLDTDGEYLYYMITNWSTSNCSLRKSLMTDPSTVIWEKSITKGGVDMYIPKKNHPYVYVVYSDQSNKYMFIDKYDKITGNRVASITLVNNAYTMQGNGKILGIDYDTGEVYVTYGYVWVSGQAADYYLTKINANFSDVAWARTGWTGTVTAVYLRAKDVFTLYVPGTGTDVKVARKDSSSLLGTLSESATQIGELVYGYDEKKCLIRKSMLSAGTINLSLCITKT